MYVTKGCCRKSGEAERPRWTRSGMHIGYARVSTDDQQLHLQMDALTTAGCTQIFHDEGISGAQVQRPGLDAALAALAPGDVLVVWRLDRLGRSMPHLVSLVHALGLQGWASSRSWRPLTRPRPGASWCFILWALLRNLS